MPKFDTRIALVVRSTPDDLSSGDRVTMGYSANVHLEFSDTLLRITGLGWDAMYLRKDVVSLGVHING
jgi:hypothetical protein